VSLKKETIRGSFGLWGSEVLHSPGIGEVILMELDGGGNYRFGDPSSSLDICLEDRGIVSSMWRLGGGVRPTSFDGEKEEAPLFKGYSSMEKMKRKSSMPNCPLPPDLFVNRREMERMGIMTNEWRADSSLSGPCRVPLRACAVTPSPRI
jgi:hypothetical protein